MFPSPKCYLQSSSSIHRNKATRCLDRYTPMGYYSNMLNEVQKRSVANRLRRIAGQVDGVRKMVDQDRYCVDILNQTAAITAALQVVEQMIMENHLNTCVVEAMRSDDQDEQREKTAEIMQIIGKYRKHG